MADVYEYKKIVKEGDKISASNVIATNTQTVQENLERIDLEVEGLTDDVADLESGKLDASKNAVATVGGLVTPTAVLSSNELVGVGVNGEQVRIQLGDGLTLSGTTSPYTLIAGGGTQLYKHTISTSTVTFTCVSNIGYQITSVSELSFLIVDGLFSMIDYKVIVKLPIDDTTVGYFNNGTYATFDIDTITDDEIYDDVLSY